MHHGCSGKQAELTQPACLREIIVKLARFLTSLGREILQLPLGTHQLQQEPGLAESVVAILRTSTSVELVNVATSIAGSMSSKYALWAPPFVHRLLIVLLFVEQWLCRFAAGERVHFCARAAISERAKSSCQDQQLGA
jgi:hypothetical protein